MSTIYVTFIVNSFRRLGDHFNTIQANKTAVTPQVPGKHGTTITRLKSHSGIRSILGKEPDILQIDYLLPSAAPPIHAEIATNQHFAGIF